jgi:hypothetical protein
MRRTPLQPRRPHRLRRDAALSCKRFVSCNGLECPKPSTAIPAQLGKYEWKSVSSHSNDLLMGWMEIDLVQPGQVRRRVQPLMAETGKPRLHGLRRLHVSSHDTLQVGRPICLAIPFYHVELNMGLC